MEKVINLLLKLDILVEQFYNPQSIDQKTSMQDNIEAP